jgi:aspartyl-tRNA(Asn)/glutamyl-tRNA(Gln) amidotransferase subunit C
MITVDEALTRKVAHLSRLALSDEEVQMFTPQLQDVLKYVELLQQVPVEGVEPMTHPFTLEQLAQWRAPLREDHPVASLKDPKGQPKVLSHAPDVLYDGFKVPQIL